MITLGQVNTLEILRETDNGAYLIDDEDNQVLLPNRYVPESFKIWDKMDVFNKRKREIMDLFWRKSKENRSDKTTIHIYNLFKLKYYSQTSM